MAEKLQIIFEGDLKQLRAELNKVIKDIDTQTGRGGGLFGNISKGFKDAFAGFTAANLALKGTDLVLNKVGQAFQAVLDKESKLAEFSAITGVTGAKLQEFGKRATELSNAFGTSTVSNIEAFKGVLSRLGPDFASSAEALKKMGENINILALASGLDATQAMDSLTTAMLQFQVDLKDPLKAAEAAATMMNVMAAGAKEGAAEIPQITEALVQVGATSKSLNVSFLETNALIQSLAQGGKYGSEAGIALRNVLTALVRPSREAGDSLERVGLSGNELGKLLTSGAPDAANNALRALRDGLMKIPEPGERAAIVSRLFGKENQAAAQTLLSLVDVTDEYRVKMEGTNTAVEQSAIIMETTQHKWQAFTTFIENQAVGVIETAKMGLAEFFAELGKGGDAFQRFSFGMLSGGYARRNAIALQKQESEERKKANKELAGNLIAQLKQIELFGKQGEAVKTLLKIVGDLSKEAEKGIDVGGNLEGLQKRVEAVREQAEAEAKLGANLKKQASTVKELKEEIDRLKGEQELTSTRAEWMKWEKQIEALQKRIDAISGKALPNISKEVREFAKTVKPIQLFDDKQVKIWDDIANNFVTLSDTKAWGTIAKNIGRISEIAGELPPALQKINDEMNEMKKASSDLSGFITTMSESFVGIFQSAEEGEGLKSFLKTVANQAITAAEAMLFAAEATSLAKAIFSGGVTLLLDTPLKIAGFTALELARAAVNSFAVGSLNVPENMIANVHKGEMIVPAPMAESVRRGDVTLSGSGSKRKTYKHSRGSVRGIAVTIGDLGRASRAYEIDRSRRAA